MYKEIKIKKSLSKEKEKEKNKSKKKTTQNSNYILTKKKESKKICTTNNNINIEYKTTKKGSNSKLNHINLKSIIKKIDLFALSLSNNYNNNTNISKNKMQKTKGKRQYTGLMKLKTNKAKDEQKTGKQPYSKEVRHSKKNSLKCSDNNNNNNNNNNNADFSSLTSSENRYNKKDFIARYKQQTEAQNTTNNKKGRETLQKHKNLYNIINYENSNINLTNNNNKRINQSHRRFFRSNNMEISKFSDLKSINNHHNKNNKNNNSCINNKEKKNSSINKRMTIGKNNHSTSNLNNKKNKNKNIILNEELKKCIFKVKSAPKDKSNITKKKLFLISYANKLKSKQIINKDNSKNTIPKPMSSNIDLKLSKIQDDNYLYNTELIKYMEKRANTSATKYKIEETENNKTTEKKIMENNYIDNALINIRGISIPGKDTQNQIKLNQDSYIIKRDINNIKNFNLFGIFDGHGLYGHTISVYVKENLVKKIMENPIIQDLKNLDNIYDQFKKNNYKIIKDIFNEIDYQLLYLNNDFDIKLSGSSCNIIIQIGDHIICANTGDSRALLIYEDDANKNDDENVCSNYQVFPLSFDCKLEIQKEKERIIKQGGIILKDSFQDENGPLRAFIKGSSLPGLTMSRSFGDKLGKDIGIIVDPLINEYILNKDVKYIIMGSNGIWEFLNNEQVMSIGNKYYLNNDPDTFCQILIKKSTELWEQNSRNIDDITLIVIYFTFL